MAQERILILDFGSQYTQLIARRVRESGVYSEIYAWDVDLSLSKSLPLRVLSFQGDQSR